MRTLKALASLVVVAAIAAQPAQEASAQRDYLDDANKSYPSAGSAPSFENQGFPRVLQHEMAENASIQAMSKYQFLMVKGLQFDMAERVQSVSPETMVLRHISGRAYQSYALKDPCHISMGVAFASTGPASLGGPQSDGCDIFAGHWLYQAGTTLRQSVNNSTLTLPVADASKLTPGQYVVIYNAPAGSFYNAEHARIVSRNVTNDTVTLAARGYKSTAAFHAAGSIVAQHVLGQGADARLWAFNMSSKSPTDSTGRTFGEFYADWLKRNYRRTRNGATTSANLAGILLDADLYFELKSAAADANNDLVTDYGMSAQGVNWLGEGLDDFYRLLTSRLPNHYLLAGVHNGRGYDYAQGTQMENWLDYGNGDFKANPQYLQLNSLFAIYLFNMGARSRGAPLTQNLTKTATKLYPGDTNASSNAPARLGLALTLMDNGYFGTHSLMAPDGWWDEYAVDVDENSPTYGEAIPSYDFGAARAHRGWLGQPLGPFKRQYDDAQFAPARSLLNDGTFDSALGSWSSQNVGISRRTSGQLDGAGALHAAPMSNYQSNVGSAKIRSESLSLIGGREYTIAFSARASVNRDIVVALGVESQPIPVGTTWRRYVMSFAQTKNQSGALLFNVGRENSEVWLDSVYVLEGNANVFRRDFDNGIAVANATSRTRTVDLGGEFIKIRGQQDPVNNGATVTSVTLPPYDGLLLVRPKGGSGGGSSGSGGGSSGSGGTSSAGSGTGLIGDLVWHDADQDGVQDSSESGFGGATVQLLSCTGTLLDAMITESDGGYSFRSLAVGDYQIRFVPPAGARLSPQERGSSRGLDSNPDTATGLSTCLPLSDGQARRGIDAGIVD